MAGDPGSVEPEGPEKRILTAFVEEANADAVLVIWSSTKKRKTSSRVCSWGNHFAVKGMLEWAFETLVGFDPEDDLNIQDELDDEEEAEGSD